jgi:hypothetical protein
LKTLANLAAAGYEIEVNLVPVKGEDHKSVKRNGLTDNELISS